LPKASETETYLPKFPCNDCL